tara:strand:- start:535 stop:771 length:237 start_codon:yes stop_codon:yes gene_type:complete
MNDNIKRDRREKFKSLASARVNKALLNLKLIGNLSNRQNYEYDDADVKKIFNVLENELRTAKQKFKKTSKKNGEFSLD